MHSITLSVLRLYIRCITLHTWASLVYLCLIRLLRTVCVLVPAAVVPGLFRSGFCFQTNRNPLLLNMKKELKNVRHSKWKKLKLSHFVFGTPFITEETVFLDIQKPEI